MKIQHKGNEVEAYRLITKKKFAQQILDGTKRVEIRAFSNFYVNMFIDPERAEKQSEGLLENGIYSIDDTIRDTQYARLTNYSGSWHLDVRITSISVCGMFKEDIEYLNEHFNFHDYDQEYKKYENYPEDKVPMFFAIAIRDIIDSKGLE